MELCWRSNNCLRGAAVRSAGTQASSEAKCTMAAVLSAVPPGPTLHLAELSMSSCPSVSCGCSFAAALCGAFCSSGWRAGMDSGFWLAKGQPFFC